MITLIRILNGKNFESYLRVFNIIVALHFLEHVAQMSQLYLLRWARPDCLGLLGLVYPWLIRSEWLHYGHALFMLIGLWLLSYSIQGRAHYWWTIAFWLAFYHHIEHFLLLSQAISGSNLWGSPVPTSLGQLLFPRIELHFFYNLMVMIPTMIALRIHYEK